MNTGYNPITDTTFGEVLFKEMGIFRDKYKINNFCVCDLMFSHFELYFLTIVRYCIIITYIN